MSPNPGKLHSVLRGGLCFLVMWAPLAFSSVEMWSRGVLIIGTWLLFLLWALRQVWGVSADAAGRHDEEWRHLRAFGRAAIFWVRHPRLAEWVSRLTDGRFPDPGALPKSILEEARLQNYTYVAGRRWRRFGVEVPLAALCVLVFFQLLPIPPGMMRWISPGTHGLYEKLFSGYGTGKLEWTYTVSDANRDRLRIPVSTDELLGERKPVEAPEEKLNRSDWLPLSLYPAATLREGLYLLTLALVMFLALQVFSEPKQIRFALYMVLAAAFLTALAGLVQRLGNQENLVYGLRPIRVPGFAMAMGPFVNRNHFCALMELAFPIAVGFAFQPFFPALAKKFQPGAGGGDIRVRSRKRTEGFSLNQMARSMVFLFLAAVMLLAVSLSGSRGGLLVSASAMTLFLVMAFYLKRGLVPSLVSVLLLAGAGAAAVWYFGHWDAVEKRVEAIDMTEWSQESRVVIWEDVLRGIREFPVLGTGWGTFRYAFPYRRTMPGEKSIADHAESDFFETWFEIGALGMGIAGWLALAIFFRGEARASFLQTGMFVGLVSAVFHGILDFPIHIPGVSYPLAFCAAMYLALSRVEDLP